MRKFILCLFMMCLSLALFSQETKVHPIQIHQAGATANQLLGWDGSKWKPVSPSTGSDDQTLTFNTSTKVLSLEDGGTVDLSGLEGSDDQSISLAGTVLTIEDGGTVDFASFMDNTDAQTVAYNKSTGVLSIANGNNVTIDIGQRFITEYITTSAGATITLSQAIPANEIQAALVSRNGLVQRIGNSSADCSISSATLTFNLRALSANEFVVVKYPK